MGIHHQTVPRQRTTRGLLVPRNMFDEFGSLATPLVAGGVFLLFVVPGFLKLLPVAVIAGSVWAVFHVAKGFAIADKRLEKRKEQ
jgi:hypothetical protein